MGGRKGLRGWCQFLPFWRRGGGGMVVVVGGIGGGGGGGGGDGGVGVRFLRGLIDKEKFALESRLMPAPIPVIPHRLDCRSFLHFLVLSTVDWQRNKTPRRPQNKPP